MTPLAYAMIAVRGLALLTNNPAFGGGSNLRLQSVSKLLEFLGELLERGDEANEELKDFAETIERMVKENREPSTAEWATLKARSDAAHDVIQEARRRAEAEENPQPEPEPEPLPTPEPEEEEVVISDEEAEETLRVTLDDDGNPVASQ